MAPENTKKQPLVISEAIPVPCKAPGIADIVGFGPTGVVILRNRINPREQAVSDEFGGNVWRIDRHVRLVADTTGNGLADIVGFGNPGVYVALNKGNNTFDKAKLVKTDFGFGAGNWSVTEHLRFMVDLRNTGRADIVGFGNTGVWASLNNGDGTFGATYQATKQFGSENWKIDKHPRFLADITGNGLLDIIGFGNDWVYVTLNTGDGKFGETKLALNDLCFNKGWRVEKHPRFVADLTGNGQADLIGFGDDGVYVAFSKGDGTFHPVKKVISDFGIAQGWRTDKHQRNVADITGNGRGDIVGFGDDGVWVSYNNGDGTFQPIKRVLGQFAYADGWRVEKHLRFLVDMTGNGLADIVGFGTAGIWVGYNDGKGGFAAGVEVYHNFGSDSPGWSIDKAVKFVANLNH